MAHRPDNSVELLKKYISGEITASQERELLDLAKNDPFLADALEGYINASASELSIDQIRIDLEQAESKINIRSGSRFVWAAAASIAVIAIALFAIRPNKSLTTTGSELSVEKIEPIHDVSSTREREMAPLPNKIESQLEELPDMEHQSAAKENSSLTAESDAVLNATTPSEEFILNADIMADNETTPSVIPTNEDIIDDELINNKNIELLEDRAISDIALTKESNEASHNEKDNTIKEEELPQTQMASQKAKSAPIQTAANKPLKESKLAKGFVLDEYGEPLIGANIIGVNTALGTVTDIDGSFRLELPWETEYLSIQYTGYEDQSVAIIDTSALIIEMSSPVVFMDEIVVTGYGNERYDKVATSSRAKPEGGMKAYKEYLKNNLRIPTEANSMDISGTVKVRFKVYPNNIIDEIEIIKSLGHGCDEEAIRLIKEGPKWEVLPKTARSAVKVISIRF